ncbi:hypothetical protein J4462_04085 [Candidatus Pacearchaeota archaeon]|nr:hypothetical protein [Candidatus Pacearchaeota archaeon]
MEKRVIALFFLMLMIFAFPVYGAGTSTGTNARTDAVDDSVVNDSDDQVVDSSSPQSARRQANMAKKAEIRQQYRDKNCESVDTRRERIKCRLARGKDYTASAGTVPEACRLNEEENKGHCVALYNTVKGCYALEGAAKDRCFKRAIGLSKARLVDESPEERPQKARDYVIALLYDLQEKIEDKAEQGDINPDVATQLIEQIVEIKQDILNGEDRFAIRGKMRELRTMWQDTMSEVENE